MESYKEKVTAILYYPLKKHDMKKINNRNLLFGSFPHLVLESKSAGVPFRIFIMSVASTALVRMSSIACGSYRPPFS